MLPGWYGFGTAVAKWLAAQSGRRARAAAGDARRMAASSGPRCPTWTWCWPRATSPSPRATPSWSATRRCASRSSSACARNGRARSMRCCSITAPAGAARGQSAARPLDPQPLPLHRSAEPRADRAAAPPPRRRQRSRRRRRASTSASTASPPGCATAARLASQRRLQSSQLPTACSSVAAATGAGLDRHGLRPTGGKRPQQRAEHRHRTQRQNNVIAAQPWNSPSVECR